MVTEIQIYSALLVDIKKRISRGQIIVTHSVSKELTEMYWDVGCLLHQRQQHRVPAQIQS